VVQVPSTNAGGAFSASVFNAAVSPNANFDFAQRYGTGATGQSGQGNPDTTASAAIVETILANPVAFPGPEDPAGNVQRMLIGTFTLKSTQPGSESVTAVDPFSGGNQSLTGPNPPTAPADGAHGELGLDPVLSQYAASPTVPSLTVTVVPEPGTLALAGLAAAGVAAWRRKK
jgi:hypothetical protein